METSRKEISAYLENISVLIIAIFLIAFPFLFATFTTDGFGLPKQILLAVTAMVTLIAFGVKMINEGRVKLRRTPFDLPILLVTGATFLSAMFAVNRFDSLIAFVPFLFAVILYFVIINFVKDEKSIIMLLGALVGGACLTAVFSVFSFLKIYILPFSFTHAQNFTPLGSLLDQAMYLALVLPIAAYIAYPMINNLRAAKTANSREIGFGIGFLITLAGLLTTLVLLFTTQKPVILPFETGFQTAFAAISQDTGRVAQGFFLGSGFGTYVTDFTRFKSPTFNANQSLWAFTFFRSSSFALELLATTGILGIASFFFLIFRILREKPVFVPLLIAIGAALFLPFSFVMQTIFIIFVALFAAIQGSLGKHATREERFFDVELHFVAFKKGIIAMTPEEEAYRGQGKDKDMAKALPVGIFLLMILLVGFTGFYSVKYVLSDMSFRRSIVAASANNGSQTYTEQVNTINLFPYRDVYYQSFSQVNLALANSIASAQPKGATVSQQTQQTIITLIQQSINAGRTATTIAPETSANWQNLSSIYRNIIGFGQNADAFAILSNQQAIVLDPNNPQEYINLGGIYYQLGQYDNAERQFQIAINLKPDFANAYYNLGHALEQKGDLTNALAAYQTVQSLITNDASGEKKMGDEIKVLQAKIGSAKQNTQAATGQQSGSTANQPPLGISSASQQLPTQAAQVKIPSPSTALVPSASATPTPTVTTAPSPTPTVKP